MKYLGTHHDTGDKLPTVGNAIWLSFYIKQYGGDLSHFLGEYPCNAGSVQKDVYIDKRSYNEQLIDAKGVDLIILCVRCLQDEFSHFNNYYMSFSQQLVEYVYKLGYKNVKVELFSEAIEIVTPYKYLYMLRQLREAVAYYKNTRNLQILAGAGDLHIETHRKFYRYLKDNGFHDFDAWSIHCINDPLEEMKWAITNLGDKPIHITEFTALEYLLAYGPNANYTIHALEGYLNYSNHQEKIKSLFQVFPARISGKYESWSVHNSTYLTKLKEFYNKYIKEVNMSNQDIKISYGEKGIDVRYLQFALKGNGHDPTYIDGDFGGLTLKALNDFQQYEGLPVVKYCDLECLLNMMVSTDALYTAVNKIISLNE